MHGRLRPQPVQGLRQGIHRAKRLGQGRCWRRSQGGCGRSCPGGKGGHGFSAGERSSLNLNHLDERAKEPTFMALRLRKHRHTLDEQALSQATMTPSTPTSRQPILVLGGTGKTGRRIVDRLQARHWTVRIGSRSASPRFDWEDRGSWAPALAGHRRGVPLPYFPDLAAPGAPEAIAALSEAGHDGQLYELTGPELIGFPEAVATIARAAGREIRYQPISREAFIDGLAQQQLPQGLIGLLDYLFTTVLDGRNAYLGDGVKRPGPPTPLVCRLRRGRGRQRPVERLNAHGLHAPDPQSPGLAG